MEWINHLFENLKNLKEFAADWVQFCANHPFLASTALALFFLVLFYISVLQAIEAGRRLRTWLRIGRLRWALVALVLVASFAGVILVHATRNLLVPVPSIQTDDIVLGPKLVLSWKYNDNNKDASLGFEVQGSKDPAFKTLISDCCGITEIPYFQLTKHLNDLVYWRVRAGTMGQENVFEPTSPWSTVKAISQYENSSKRIRNTKILRVGVSQSLNQGFFRFYRKGRVTGLDIMVTQEIARKLSILAGDTVRIIYKPVAWSELLDLPAKGSVDMIISSITSLPEREVTHKLRFTKPYYRTTLSWISTDAKVLANPFLKDNVIGVQAGTTSENVAKATIAAVEDQSRPKIQTFEQNVIALEQLQRPSAPIALVLADTPFAEAEARKSESGASEKLLTRVVVENDFPEPSRKSIALGEPYAIATSSIDSDLLTVINNSIEFIEKNGQLAELEHAARDQYNDTLN